MALSSGAIAGFVIASIISFLYLLCLVYYLIYRSEHGPSYDAENQYPIWRACSEALAQPAIGEQRRLESHEAQKEFGENVHGHKLVNHGSMQAKGIAVVRGDRDMDIQERVV
jgi:hypothetical protein